MNDDDLTIYLATPLDVTLDLQRDLSGMALTFRQHADADDGAEVLTKGLTIGSPASAGLVAETLYRYRVTDAQGAVVKRGLVWCAPQLAVR
jgi:hypothetical protein